MKPIDFPEKYENLMRVAQQALANQQYQQAKELFQRAYELKESFEANSLLVFCLYELDEKKEALKQALLHEKQYLQNEEFAEFYFDLLISTQDFLYARKLIASTDFYEAFEQRVIEKIQFAEELSGQMKSCCKSPGKQFANPVLSFAAITFLLLIRSSAFCLFG